MSFNLRTTPAPGDLAAMAALLSQIRPEPVTPEEIADRRSWLPQGSVLHEIVAEDESGRFLGFAEAYRFPTTLKGRSMCTPPSRRAPAGVASARPW